MKQYPAHTTMTHFTCAARDLRLGDKIITAAKPEENPNPYSDCTVIKIDETGVTVMRPYVHTSDFVYTGGVIGYIGIEQYTISLDTIVTIKEESSVPDVIAAETDVARLMRAGRRGEARLAELEAAIQAAPTPTVQ